MDDASVKNDTMGVNRTDGPPSDLLGTLLANPEMMQKLKAVLGTMMADSSASSATPATAEESADGRQTVATTKTMGDGLATLLSNPAMIERLPQMLAVLKPMMEANAEKKPQAAESVNASSPVHHREHLLLALKPFLSKERCEAVDAILRISQLGEVLGHLR